MALPLGQDKDIDFDAYKNLQAGATSDEAVEASFDQAIDDTAVMIWARHKALNEYDKSGAKMLSPEEANARYPGMPTAWQEPVNPYQAQFEYDREIERNVRLQKIQSGPQDWWTKTKMFGAGMVAHLMDPIEFGVGIFTGWGIGAVAARGALGAKVALTARAVGAGTASTGARIGYNVAEAAAGNLIENVAQEQAMSAQQIRENREYDPQEGMMNVAIGSFALPTVVGLKDIGFWGGNRLKRAIRGTSPEADLAVARGAVGQLDQGIRPNSEFVMEALAKETDVNPELHPGKITYQYAPITKDAQPKELYVVTSGADINSDRVHVGDEYLGGTQLTDNPGVANAAAVRSFADSEGAVWKVNTSELNPVNLSQKIPDDLQAEFGAVAKAVGVTDKQLAELTGREVLDMAMNAIDEGDADETLIKTLKAELSKKGYNSWTHDGTKRLGYDHAPHNVVEVFDDAVLKPVGHYKADPEVRADATDQLKQRAQEYNDDVRNRVDVSRTDYDEFTERVKTEDHAPGAFDRINDEALENNIADLKAWKEQGLLDEQGAKQLDELIEMDAKFEAEDKLMKAVVSCVRG